MTKRKVLLVGESWVTTATHIKGFDQFSTVTFHLGAEPLLAALKGTDFELRYMTAHEAQRDFPLAIEGLGALTRNGTISSDRLLTHFENATAAEVTRLMQQAADLMKSPRP